MHLGVIARAETEQRNLVVARAVHELLRLAQQRLLFSFAHRAIDIAGLAKPASAGAAAHDLERNAVMNDVHIRDDRLAEERRAVKVFDRAARDRGGNVFLQGERSVFGHCIQ